MAKEAISEVPIPLPYALNLIYDTTRLSILCSKAKEHQMHWNLIDGTLKGAPISGPLSMVQSVVINFSSNIFSKSLLKGSPLLCTSLWEVISFPDVWRPIFCKSKKDLYLVQKYGGQYV